MSEQAAPSSFSVPDEQLGWVVYLPVRLRDYALLARLDRPIGTWLLLIPCWWGQALAPGGFDFWLAVMFTIGAFAMRGAGCTVNDLADRDFDRQVERTRNRPLASGRLRTRQALAFLAFQLMIGALVLTQLPWIAVIVSLCSVPLIVVYPYMKRITYWPQLFLGITFNWGILVGYTATAGVPQAEAILLYIAGLFWTLGYDTIYAHQDKEDDALIGVKSTALLFGRSTKIWVGAFYSLMIAAIAIGGMMAGLGWPFFAALTVPTLMLAHQTCTLDIDDVEGCLSRFRAHRIVGLAILGALLLGHLAPVSG